MNNKTVGIMILILIPSVAFGFSAKVLETLPTGEEKSFAFDSSSGKTSLAVGLKRTFCDISFIKNQKSVTLDCMYIVNGNDDFKKAIFLEVATMASCSTGSNGSLVLSEKNAKSKIALKTNLTVSCDPFDK